jgi:3-methylcrotonyl-CoA carboxylase alpha subunit
MVAQGEKLPFTQNELKQTGHAIEVRLYAEDPDNNFLPSIGKITKIGTTTLRHMRLDCGYVDGNDVSISFDPMLAKLVSWSENRESAARKLSLALNDIVFLGEGIKTNRNYLQRILNSKEFLEGKTYTHFVNTYADKLKPKIPSNDDQALAIAAMLFSINNSSEEKVFNESKTVWDELIGFRSL